MLAPLSVPRAHERRLLLVPDVADVKDRLSGCAEALEKAGRGDCRRVGCSSGCAPPGK
jgi:hypothetical protein